MEHAPAAPPAPFSEADAIAADLYNAQRKDELRLPAAPADERRAPSGAVLPMSDPLNITTRRYPRSMAEAFPQDHSDAVTTYRRPFDRHDVIVMCGGCVVAAVVMAAGWLGWA